ncbi:MAG: substrate-binding domain-containing protein [Dehalococcoidia bacterium]|nr:substrate-binding domain-containing protein [Dehalococcoidia bacterium]
MKKNLLSILLILVLAISMIGWMAACDDDDEATSPESASFPVIPGKGRLKVATTTSLYDTGLWGYLEPMFEKKYGVELDIINVGSGIALKYGENGDVDVLTVHDKAAEEKFIADGFGTERTLFAYNHFVIVGPASDPAGIKGMSPEDAFTKLFNDASAEFISRSDSSGTHSKEKAIWKAAGFDYATQVQKAGKWYVEAGQGMGPTLIMANEKQGYTLSDIGTYLAFKGKTDLVPVVDQGSILLNIYSVIPTTKTKKTEMVRNMVTFLTSPEVQKIIGDYGVADYGQQLFTPCAGQPEPTS